MKNRKGFTMAELLAVIVILAILMTIAIPAVIKSLQSSKKKTFTEYANRVKLAAEEKYYAANADLYEETCVIYSIKDDLGFADTNTYSGYIMICSEEGETNYYLTMWSKDYTLKELSQDDSPATDYKYYFIKFNDDISVSDVQKNNMDPANKEEKNAMSDLCYGTNEEMEKDGSETCLKSDLTTEVEKVIHYTTD